MQEQLAGLHVRIQKVQELARWASTLSHVYSKRASSNGKPSHGLQRSKQLCVDPNDCLEQSAEMLEGTVNQSPRERAELAHSPLALSASGNNKSEDNNNDNDNEYEESINKGTPQGRDKK